MLEGAGSDRRAAGGAWVGAAGGWAGGRARSVQSAGAELRCALPRLPGPYLPSKRAKGWLEAEQVGVLQQAGPTQRH